MLLRERKQLKGTRKEDKNKEENEDKLSVIAVSEPKPSICNKPPGEHQLTSTGSPCHLAPIVTTIIFSIFSIFFIFSVFLLHLFIIINISIIALLKCKVDDT
jgi:hypothetical protein